MKTRFLFMLLCAVTLNLTSCSSNDDNDYKDLIVGAWKLTTMEIEKVEVPVSAIGMSMSITFKADGTYDVTVTGEDEFENGSGTYKLSGKTLTIYDEGESMKWQIVSINSGKAVFIWSVEGYDAKATFIK